MFRIAILLTFPVIAMMTCSCERASGVDPGTYQPIILHRPESDTEGDGLEAEWTWEEEIDDGYSPGGISYAPPTPEEREAIKQESFLAWAKERLTSYRHTGTAHYGNRWHRPCGGAIGNWQQIEGRKFKGTCKSCGTKVEVTLPR
jgi:hypothetical protein